jgi:hypothetical protein
MRSRSDGFQPIRQVGVATSIGVPLIGVGLFLLIFAVSAGGTLLWILCVVLILAGVLTAASNKVI